MGRGEKSKYRISPPKLADRFLDWFCRDEWVEPIRGDLYEQFLIDSDNKKPIIAKLNYWLNVFNFLRPFAIKKNRFTSNHVAMFKNVIKTFFRQFRRNPSQNLTNIVGLCIGFCVVFITMLWVNHHASFDRFHTCIDTIYKVMTNSAGSDGVIQTREGIVYEVMEEAMDQIPEIGTVTRIISNWRWPSEQCFKIDENKSCIYSRGIFSDTSFFKVFDFEIVSGSPTPLHNPRSIALSESVVKKLYGEENPVGKTYLVDNHLEVTISAVYKDVPKTSSLQFEFIAPLELAYTLWGQKPENMKAYSFITYARLSDNNPAMVQQKISDLTIMEKYENLSPLLHPMTDEHLYTQFENGKATGGLAEYLQIITLFALFILVMSMVNFINLTTAQASIRGKEIGVRKVNGASQFTLQLQFMFETLLKVLFAAGLALFLAYIMLPMLNDLISEHITFAVTTSMIMQMVLVIVLTTLLSGFYPALLMSRFNPVQILKNLPFKGSGKGSARRWLTIAQVSISGIIVILTSVFYLQLSYLQEESLGYDRKGIMMLEPTYQHIKGFDNFKANLTQYHQIKALGISNANMINATYSTDDVTWVGKNTEDQIFFRMIGGDNGLFDVFEMEFIEGIGFNPADTSDQVILTESAVKRMNLENPIGSTITIWNSPCKITGVVPDFNTESLHHDPVPIILYEVKPQNSGTFYIRYDQNNPIESIELIEKEYAALEPFFDMKYQILDDEYQKAYNEEQVVSRLSSFAMLVAMVIAIIGILGLSTFNILRRYREIGLRKIFGATRMQIIQILSVEFIFIVLIANLIAGGVSVWMMDEWLSGFAYRIGTPYVLLPINLCVTLLIILTLIGIQSLRVTNLNPTEITRVE